MNLLYNFEFFSQKVIFVVIFLAWVLNIVGVDAVGNAALVLTAAILLPFIIFADANGAYIDGYSGVVTPPYLIKKLNEHSGS